MRLLPAHPSWALLLLAAAALVGGAAAYPATCGDMQTPTAGNDQTPGLALSGPALVAPSAAGYAFAVNPTSDALEFYVQSAPGVGNTGKSAFTRKLGIALSGAGAASYSAATAGAPGTCYRLWDRFTLAAPATNVSALAGPLLTAAEATGAADTCYFNHHFSIPWATFRADGNCGLNLANNGSANTFSGRLHVWWEDYDSMSAQTPIRTAATVWYPVTISVASDATSTTGNVNNVEEPYNNDFEITELTYSNIGTSVHVTMKYQLSTKWPYYPYLPANDADKLVNTAGTYGLLPLGSWPSKTWTSTIDPANDGTNCAAVGDTCTLKGELKYSWEPTAPGSCTIAGTYQLDLTLGCSSSGGNLQNCGAAMRSALALPTLGQVVVPETILNLCAVESAPSSAAPPVGGAIGFTSNMNFLSAVSKIDYVSYRVARADLSSSDAQVPAYWELWDAANLKPSTLGTTVKLSAEAIDVSSTSWDLISSFTPNTLVRETALGSVDFVNPSRAAYMIVLPDDHGASFEFSVQVVIRVYTAGARRMLYRDITRIEKRQAGGSEITFESGPLSMEVPSSIPYNASFLINSLTYSKSATGVVTAFIGYHLELNWPYYGYYSNTTDGAQLINTAGSYGGLLLTEYPQSTFDNNYPGGLDGQHALDGTVCTSYGQKCTMEGVLSFSWKPTPGTPNSCTLSSTTNQQFDFKMGCLQLGYNTASDCDQPLRTVVGYESTFAAWSLQGNLDFCKTAQTDFPITWGPAFDVPTGTRNMGQAITASGTFQIDKKLSALKVESFRVSRTDLTSAAGTPYWELWTPDLTNTYATDSGATTSIGGNVAFARTITSANDGKSWTISTTFTPNIKVSSAPSSLDYADRPAHMIVLPWDNNKGLNFYMTISLRLFSDTTMTPAGRRRRLLYRQVDKVQTLSAPQQMQRAEARTSNVQIFVGKAVDVASGPKSAPAASTGLSGTVIGVAVGVSVSAVAVLSIAGLLIWRHKKRAREFQETSVVVDGNVWKSNGKAVIKA